MSISISPLLKGRVVAAAVADGRSTSGWICRQLERALVEIDARAVLSASDAGLGSEGFRGAGTNFSASGAPLNRP